MTDLRQILINNTTPLIADGGMSTSLYDRGFYINRSFEELCLTSPQTVIEVTSEFKKAGANLLLTNTFSATLPKLTRYGLQDQHQKIIQAACEIAKQVGAKECFVLANMGPLGIVLEPLGPTSFEEAVDHFKITAEIFEHSQINGFNLEGFHDLTELEAAVQAVRSISQKPLFVHVAIKENLRTSYGHSLQEFAERFKKYEIDVYGISGDIGPSGMLSALEVLRPLVEKPISLKPNAGLPQYVNDQYIYLCNPDYIAKYAKRFIQAGARIVGGGSGVSESHIKAISNTLRMLEPQSRTEVKKIEINQKPTHKTLTTKIENRSKLGSYFKEKKPIYSVEINPPNGVRLDKFSEHCKALVRGGVEFVNIPDGARAMARMSSLQLAIFVKNNFGLEPIPHFTCRDRNLIGLQSDLLGCFVNGVRNVLLVTGDPPKLGNCPDATAVYDVDAIGLTHIVSRMNKGLDLGGSDFGEPTQFMAGVALNPTAHNQELEIKRFKYKVEAGADYAITQPIYDLEAYKRFLDRLGPISIPIVMGIWPLVSLRNAEFLKNEVPGVEVPNWVITEMEKAGESKEEALKRGIEISIETINAAKDLVDGFQVSAPFNKVEIALQVIHSVSNAIST